MPNPTTYDLSCLIPVLEAGDEIPGFHKAYGNWFVGPTGQDREVELFPVAAATPSDYFAAIGWLTEKLWEVKGTHKLCEAMGLLPGLCAAKLKENTDA
jgi:hypothetical protein